FTNPKRRAWRLKVNPEKRRPKKNDAYSEPRANAERGSETAVINHPLASPIHREEEKSPCKRNIHAQSPHWIGRTLRSFVFDGVVVRACGEGNAGGGFSGGAVFPCLRTGS
ncbi:MAG: hypothetical protein ACKVX9_23820, partial [Blastocatellia bacterium]